LDVEVALTPWDDRSSLKRCLIYPREQEHETSQATNAQGAIIFSTSTTVLKKIHEIQNISQGEKKKTPSKSVGGGWG